MRSFLYLAIALTALAMPAHADHCVTWSSQEPEITIPTPVGHYYIEIEFVQPMCEPCAIWIYEESNGVDGLQRDDVIVDGTCHGMIAGDRIVF